MDEKYIRKYIYLTDKIAREASRRRAVLSYKIYFICINKSVGRFSLFYFIRNALKA